MKGFSTDDERHKLDYAAPATERRARFDRFDARVARGGGLLMLGAVLLFASALLPVPRGMWYFGERPAWVVAIDGGGLWVGPYQQPTHVLGRVPLVAIELFVFTAPVLLVARYVRRQRERRASAL